MLPILWLEYNTYDYIPSVIGYCCGGCCGVCYDYDIRKQVDVGVVIVVVIKEKLKAI